MGIFSKLLSKASNEDIIRFNYELNFTIIPGLTKEYNNNMSSDYTTLLNYKAPGNVSKTVDGLYRKVKTILSEIPGHYINKLNNGGAYLSKITHFIELILNEKV